MRIALSGGGKIKVIFVFFAKNRTVSKQIAHGTLWIMKINRTYYLLNVKNDPGSCSRVFA